MGLADGGGIYEMRCLFVAVVLRSEKLYLNAVSKELLRIDISGCSMIHTTESIPEIIKGA